MPRASTFPDKAASPAARITTTCSLCGSAANIFRCVTPSSPSPAKKPTPWNCSRESNIRKKDYLECLLGGMKTLRCLSRIEDGIRNPCDLHHFHNFMHANDVCTA